MPQQFHSRHVFSLTLARSRRRKAHDIKRGGISTSTPEFKYEKVLDDLTACIRNGTFPPGSKLSTLQQLSAQYQTSPITIKRAIQELKNAGLLTSRRGSGYFVPAPAPIPGGDSAISLVFPMEEGNPNHTPMMAGITECLSPLGFEVTLQNTGFSVESERAALSRVLEQRPSGVIYYPVFLSQTVDLVIMLHARGIPLVLLDKDSEGLPIPCVTSDNIEGGYLAASRLLRAGCGDVAFLSLRGLAEGNSVRDRFLGYCRAVCEAQAAIHNLSLQEAGLLPFDQALSGTARETERLRRIRFVQRLSDQGIGGIFAANDAVALTLLRAIRDAGKCVPSDFSVIGFDNSDLCSQIEVPLTSVAQEFREMGRHAAGIILDALSGRECRKFRHIIPVRLIERESVRP